MRRMDLELTELPYIRYKIALRDFEEDHNKENEAKLSCWTPEDDKKKYSEPNKRKASCCKSRIK